METVFQTHYRRTPKWIARAPGRVNLIGEHTDYNDGFVLPMALECGTTMYAAPNGTDVITLRSTSVDDVIQIDLTRRAEALAKGHWANYVIGVVAGFQQRNLPIGGFDALVHSTVPLGGGLSSSAALEVATATVLEAIVGEELDPVDKALLCQRAENEYAGMPCGNMDQLISTLGMKDHVLLLDCRSNRAEQIEFTDPAVSVLIINSNVKHYLVAGGEYAVRRAQCEAAARALNVKSLRDVSARQLEEARSTLDPVVYRRALHVVGEIERTVDAAARIRARDWRGAGQLMYASHQSLSRDFEVSCAEIDLLVELARGIGIEGGVYGCRITGGGFGGCAVALIDTAAEAEITRRLTTEYFERTKIQPLAFSSRPAQGATLLAPEKKEAFTRSGSGAPAARTSRAASATATTTTLLDSPHRRVNALTGESILVSPHRNQRPWQGRTETTNSSSREKYDPKCYLCPGNERANGERNPQYQSTYAFTNDYPALLPNAPAQRAPGHELLRADPQRGTCRVLCFSPRHDLSLAQMAVPDIGSVVDLWAQQTEELGREWRWVQIFENKGELMGCSNPHPHGQIWASDALPNEPAKELAQQRAWFARSGSPLLVDYHALEVSAGERIVLQTRHWLALVPWWALWPFELLILPRRHVLRIPDLTPDERSDLATLLGDVLSRYDRLFATSFPYSMGWHGAPTDDGNYQSWQLHAHIYPPLLRSATVKKFMVGYELLAEPQRDLTPEQAAQVLRGLAK